MIKDSEFGDFENLVVGIDVDIDVQLAKKISTKITIDQKIFPII